ncbi:hypothetical protein FisN_UnNu008 [Fistulifera solaris]|uniref:BTB domain-containing protein n=1 Tax=Fistulifera solaris TaxID=1519565 RepID=A0A1Z5J9W0_FISSO|nr:hypothetical protein FisN_UnNu008 [Fistulifera solaris]|eukprot:GAX10775.1 hypothetical protein FisN_UnNu008 [Fistulifera solaris]
MTDGVSLVQQGNTLKTDAQKQADEFASSSTTKPRVNARTDIVHLNVGGTRYEVSRSTLMHYEGSMLASLISGKWKEGEGDVEIFIDRNGRRFEWVLDYLRSDRAYVPDLSDQLALKEELDYFGIAVDMSKVSVTDDFVTINELSQEIKVHKATIAQKEKRIAAIKESYRLAGEFADYSENEKLKVRLSVNKDVDTKMLRRCLLSRGLHVLRSGSKESGAPTLYLCVAGQKSKCVTKLTK